MRKKHPHPPLVPPRWIKALTYNLFDWHREKKKQIDNDEGRVIGNRVFTYHPTKGWRNRRFA